MQTAEEFFQDSQPEFRLEETVHLGVYRKHGDGFVGKLQTLDLENGEAVIVADIGGHRHVISGHAGNLSKLH
jgi:hypothetical protein